MSQIKLLQNWKFHFFPFDDHKLVFLVQLESANLSSVCEQFKTSLTFAEDWEAAIPDWSLYGKNAVNTLLQSTDTCRVEIRLVRRAAVFLVNSLTAIIVIVWGEQHLVLVVTVWWSERARMKE